MLDIALTGPNFLTLRIKAIRISGIIGMRTKMGNIGAPLTIFVWSVPFSVLFTWSGFFTGTSGNNDFKVFPINIKYPIQKQNCVPNNDTSTSTIPVLPRAILPMSLYMIFLSTVSLSSCNSPSVALGSLYFGLVSNVLFTAAFLHLIISWLQWSVMKAINARPIQPNCWEI